MEPLVLHNRPVVVSAIAAQSRDSNERLEVAYNLLECLNDRA